MPPTVIRTKTEIRQMYTLIFKNIFHSCNLAFTVMDEEHDTHVSVAPHHPVQNT